MSDPPDDHDDDDVPTEFLQTPEEFSNLLLREIHQLIAQHEKQAADTGKMVTFGVELAQQVPGMTGRGHAVMRYEFVCEPGKPARQVRAEVQDPIMPEEE